MKKRVRIEEIVFGAKISGCGRFFLAGCACAIAWMALAVPPAIAQGSMPAAGPVALRGFDVATIKPHPGPRDRQAGVLYRADGIAAELPLSGLVMQAYEVRSPGRVSGGPGWAESDWYDIEAKMSDADVAEFKKLSPEESKKRSDAMLQALLAERFKLKVHAETKQVPIYDLVVAKQSSKLVNSTTDANPPLGKNEDGTVHKGIKFLKNTSLWQAWSMESLAGFLSQQVSGAGRPVVDKTGLAGTYDFPMNWSVYSAALPRPSTTPGEAADPADSTSIFTALGEIGLKLVPSTGPSESIVIDHVEKPTEN